MGARSPIACLFSSGERRRSGGEGVPNALGLRSSICLVVAIMLLGFNLEYASSSPSCSWASPSISKKRRNLVVAGGVVVREEEETAVGKSRGREVEAERLRGEVEVERRNGRRR